MKLKNTIIVLISLTIVLLCMSCVSASHANDTLSLDCDDAAIMQDESIEPISENESVNDGSNANGTQADKSRDTNGNTSINETSAVNDTQTNTSPSTPAKVNKKEVYGLCSNAFIQKSNKYFTVKICKFNEKTLKLDVYKNVKITVKVKIGSNTKTYNVITNSKGVAKVLNVKNLKVGTYKVTVTSNDERYKINEKGLIGIFSKKTKSVTVKMNSRKKVKNDYIEAFYITKNSQYKKGVYTQEYNAKNPQNSPSHTFITKAKFFFKNKKTGKVITKTVKSKVNKIYGWDYPSYKLIKGYTPIKAQVWYTRC
ncbi:MAG: hypothetical protein IJ287_07925 [Methanobrevibacter sp.]|nr:hypothetical protein [Methanobrevibacter sp.]